MPDAHVGIGATVGSVIPTEGAVVPSFAGVDLGCGMIATETVYRAEDLPDNLSPLHSLVSQRIPAGVGKGRDLGHRDGYRDVFGVAGEPLSKLSARQQATAIAQFGTLGSGNHFVEVSLDERGKVWTVLHSGSRGIGNQLATYHIGKAKGLMREYLTTLGDLNLAYFTEGTPEFAAYIADMLWAQRYAYESRARMNSELLKSLAQAISPKRTRKENAVTVQVIKRKLDKATLKAQMHGKAWNAQAAGALIDEDPRAYKDVRKVMADQSDLTEIVHTLTQVLNYKGTAG
jgi:tRNA-splicing ligase RtcB (3'-phosphate/5'-hydroxy nucleic acid ligase)